MYYTHTHPSTKMSAQSTMAKKVSFADLDEEDASPVAKRRRLEDNDTEESSSSSGMPNKWMNPVWVDDFKFYFKIKNDSTRGLVPLIHNDGLSVFTVMGSVRSSNFTSGQFSYETKHAEVKLIPDSETLALFEKMTSDAADWLVENKANLSSDWQKKLKSFKPDRINKWWFTTATKEDTTPCIKAKRLLTSAFDIYQLVNKDPLKYDRVAGKPAGEGDDLWTGKNFIPRSQNPVLMKLMPMITSFGNKIGISVRFVGDILMLKSSEKPSVKKVNFGNLKVPE